jgi:hypothetical protein
MPSHVILLRFASPPAARMDDGDSTFYILLGATAAAVFLLIGIAYYMVVRKDACRGRTDELMLPSSTARP